MVLLYTLLPEEHIQFRAILIAPMKSMSVIITSRIVLNIRKMLLYPKALTVDTLIMAPDAAFHGRSVEVEGVMVFGNPHFSTADDSDVLEETYVNRRY